MPTATTTPKLDPLEVPCVLVTVERAELTGEKAGVAASRVEVHHELGRPSSFVVETAELGAETLDWFDGSAVQEGRPIAISMGWGANTLPVFTGEILGVELEVSTSEDPCVSVRGLDRLHRLARARRTRAFVQRSDAAIVSDIAAEHDLIPDATDAGLTHPYLLQRDQTDLAFLRARARALGYVLRVEDRRLRFGPRLLADSPVVTAKLGDNLMSLFLRTSALGQVGEVEARGWDPAEQAAIVAKASAADLRLMGGDMSGPELADASFKAQTTSAPGVPILAAKAAELAAAAELEALALTHVACEGRLVGTPALRPGDILAVAGFGPRLSGNYWLTRVRHIFDDEGFFTTFEGRRTAT